MRFSTKYKKVSRPRDGSVSAGNKANSGSRKPSRIRTVYTRYIAAFLVTLLVIAIVAIAYPGAETYPYYGDNCQCCEIHTVYTSITIPRGQSLADMVPAGPYLEGYAFAHWSGRRSGAAFDFTQPLYQDMTIYAIWLHDYYGLDYDYSLTYDNEPYLYHNDNETYQYQDHNYDDNATYQYQDHNYDYDVYNNYEYNTQGHDDNDGYAQQYQYARQYQPLYEYQYELGYEYQYDEYPYDYQYNDYPYDAYHQYENEYYTPVGDSLTHPDYTTDEVSLTPTYDAYHQYENEYYTPVGDSLTYSDYTTGEASLTPTYDAYYQYENEYYTPEHNHYYRYPHEHPYNQDYNYQQETPITDRIDGCCSDCLSPQHAYSPLYDPYYALYIQEDTVTITFMWNHGARQITHADIELNDRGNVTVAVDIDYMVILDGDYIHIRFIHELENVSVSMADSTWTYEVNQQFEETEFHDDYGYVLFTETITYTVVTVTHDILSRNSGYIGFMPLASNWPAGFSRNVLAAPFDESAWITAVGANIAGNNVVVAVPQNVTMPAQISISGDRHVIITSYGTDLNSSLTNHTAPPTTFSITRTGTAGRHFSILVGATLTLSHIIVDGGIVPPAATPAARGGISLPNMNTSLYILPGTVIRYNRAVTGGGVHTSNTFARVVMLGGVIRNNVATSTSGINGGGGVHIGGGSFYMRNGDIINNISLSAANNQNGGGGGVLISGGNATTPTMFFMDDDPLTPGAGTRNITGNTASHGGGVLISGGSSAGHDVGHATFIMDGNSNISNNTTIAADVARGFGVGVRSGSFIMDNGTISNNMRPSNTTGNSRGGGVYVSFNTARFFFNGGTISGHTVTQYGGGVHVAGSAEFEMAGGTISNNTVTGTAVTNGGGGVHVAGADSRFFFNSGTIQNNHAAGSGGGIFLTETTNMNPLLDGSFPQLYVLPAAVFSNNTAGNGSATPPSNANTATNIAIPAQVSGGYWHPLNNLDINFFYIASDWFVLNSVINSTNVARIVIHPTGSAAPPGIVGTDFNLIISDPGDGNTITTVALTGDGLATAHTISVGRTVTIAAAPGANIVLRMPAPGSPNTPNQAPWASPHMGLSRHFSVIPGGDLTLGGGVGFGTLTLDGNVSALGAEANQTRGGVTVGSSILNPGSFTLQHGGVIYNNRNGNGGGLYASGNAMVYMTGGSIINNISNEIPITGNNAGGGGVGLFNTATFTMTGGTISNNTAVHNGGGISHITSGTHTIIDGGTITGNTANNIMQGGGGIFVFGTASSLNFISGTISNNHSAGNGGGIFATEFTMIDPIPLPSGAYFLYPQLSVSTSAIFSGNTSAAGGNNPPANAAAATQITNAAQRSGGFLHPLNNLDINFFFSNADWARMSRLIADPAGPATIIIHPTGAGVLPGWDGPTTYNLVITDPGGGSLITTISLQGAASPHNIGVNRSITLAAAAGADIVIRMPVPGAPNTPNIAPWTTVRNDLERHFVVGSGNITLGGGAGFGNLTLDGNANQNTSNRGGITLGINAGLTVQAGGVIYNNRATNGGAVSLGFSSSNLNMSGGSIAYNFAVAGGGVALTGNGAQFVMTGGSINGNTAINIGGGVQVAVSGGSNLFTFNGGTISNNSAANGGGVHVATFNNLDPLPVGTHFPQVMVSSNAIFTGNVATGGSFEPPANAVTNTNIAVTTQVSGGFWHPLNNSDINFFRTILTDWRRLNNAVINSSVSNILIHPAGTIGVTDGLVGSTYNLIISDPSDGGNVITTIQLGNASPSHSITVIGRTVSISAGSGGDIILRMPAPCASNTPNVAPWLSSTENTDRHFLIRHNGNLTLHGGTGTLTLDGNSKLVPITMDGARGGVELGGGAFGNGSAGSFVLNTGGIIYNNRAIGSSFHTGGGGGVNVINAQNAPTGASSYPSALNFRMYGGYIRENYARWRGGGVSLDSQSGGRVNFIMEGGRIYDNRSSAVGGGISICCGVRTWLNNGYVHDNRANYGGGMFIGEFTAPYNHIAIHGGEIFNNTATYNGGGVHTGNLTGNRFTMTGGHIHSNYAVSVDPNHGNGGGIFHHAGRMFLFGGRINDNHASGSGGGLYSTDNAALGQIGEFIMDVNRQMIRNLNTLGTSGSGNPPLPGQPAYVPNPNYPNGFLEINNNRARVNGGGASLMTRSEFDEFNIPFAICDLVEIVGNTAGVYGGGIFLGNVTRRVYMSGGIIANNGHPTQVYTNTGTSAAPVRSLVNIRTRNGGGLYMDDGMFTLYSGNITGNAALGHYTLDPSNNQIWNGGYGGGVHMGTNASTFIITDYVPSGGGAPVPGVINFTNNIARMGGAVHYYHGNWSYTDNTGPVNFIGNIAAQRGAALAITNNRTLNINHLWTFSDNSAGQYGGAIYLNNSVLNMSGGLIGGTQGVIAGNTAVRGAGVYAGNGTVFNMTGGTIRLNTATDTGGGIATHDGRTVFNMHGGLISHNHAVRGGGIGMLAGSTVNITPQGGGQPAILGNTANFGAGVHVYGIENRAAVPVANHGASTLTMNGGTIGGTSVADANIAAQSGGGIFVAASTMETVGPGRQTRNIAILNSNSTVSRNIANATGSATVDGGGGGIYVTAGGQLNATSANITNNNAPNGMGGGIFSEIHEYLNPLVNIAPGIPANLRAYRNLNLVNVTFSGNTSSFLSPPPSNADTTTLPHITFASTSPAVPPGSLHPLNNHDINYVGEELPTNFYFHKTGMDVGVANPVLLPGAQFILVRFNGTGTPPVGIVTSDMIGSGLGQWTQVGDTRISSNVAGEPMVFAMLSERYYHIIEIAPPVGFQMPFGQWRLFVGTGGSTLTITNIYGGQPLASIWGPIVMQDAQGEDFDVRMIGNLPEIRLPMAGGTGSIVYLIAGSVFISLALVLLGAMVVINKRRRVA